MFTPNCVNFIEVDDFSTYSNTHSMKYIITNNIRTHILIMKLHKIGKLQNTALSYSFRKAIIFLILLATKNKQFNLIKVLPPCTMD